MSGEVIEGDLPPGWRIELDTNARRTDEGRTLIGGSPLRVLRLTSAGVRWLDSMIAGQPPSSSPRSLSLARRLVEAGLANPLPPAGHGVSPRDVAVVVPVRDAAHGLARTLAGIAQVGEVVVVDDGSRDPSTVRRAAGGATVLRNERSAGPGAARERGWRATSRPVIVFLDANVETEGDWLQPLLDHLACTGVGAAAPRIAAHRGTAPRSLGLYERTRSPLDLGRLAGSIRPRSRVPYAPTAALVVRRAALESISGFDEGLRVGEDVDLVWRLHAAGWGVRYEPAVAVTHPSRSSFRSWIGQRVTYGASAAALAQRHGAAGAPLSISPSSALTWLALLVGRPILGVGIGAAEVVALSRRLSSVDHPAREALRITGSRDICAGKSVATALRRTWWPLAAILAARCPRSRPAVLAALVVPPLFERRELDPIRYAILRLADDIAYGSGVWIGCMRARSPRALLPSFRSLRT